MRVAYRLVKVPALARSARVPEEAHALASMTYLPTAGAVKRDVVTNCHFVPDLVLRVKSSKVVTAPSGWWIVACTRSTVCSESTMTTIWWPSACSQEVAPYMDVVDAA
jgi:hypothetical protein